MEQIKDAGNAVDGIHMDPEQMQAILSWEEEAVEAAKCAFDTLLAAIKPIAEWAVSTANSIIDVLAPSIVPPKWLHLASHAKRARTRKKYRNRIRAAVLAAIRAAWKEDGTCGPSLSKS